MSDYEEGSSSIGWFLAGLGLGALLGVLYAPKSGAETRDDLAASAREGKEYLARQSQVVRDQANQWVDRGREQFDDYVERGKDLYSQGRDQVSEYVDKGRDVLNQQVNRVGAAVNAGKDAFAQTTGGSNSNPQG